MKKLKVRSMIIASPGNVLIQYDLKQAESWVVAHLANEEKMKNALAHDDIHMLTACEAFYPFFKKKREEITDEFRYPAKQFNHATAYRMGPQRAMELINKQSPETGIVISLHDAKILHDLWISFYNLSMWWSDIERTLDKTRTMVTPYGRIRTFFDPWGQELFKKATAHVPQSTVSDHNKGAIHPKLRIAGGLREVYKRYVKTGACSLLNEGHDSILVECRLSSKDALVPDIAKLQQRPLIINDEEFTIPVEVEVGERWGELTKVTL
jgi:hypothetical protein